MSENNNRHISLFKILLNKLESIKFEILMVLETLPNYRSNCDCILINNEETFYFIDSNIDEPNSNKYCMKCGGYLD